MTLILTEISPLGIAMAADTAVTNLVPQTGQIYVQPNTALKLQLVPYLNAAISCWGIGEISGLATDQWLSNFIATNSGVSGLDDLANKLTVLLNDQVDNSKNGENRLGFHMAGFVDHKGKSVPSFYHIHDGPSTTLASRGILIDPHIFNANHDLPPDVFLDIESKGTAWITRNGDYQLYAAI